MSNIGAIILALAALASSANLAPAAAADPASAEANESEVIVIDPDGCQYLTLHEPAPDVAYRPGVDVDGRPVAPADLDDTGRIEVPEVYETYIVVRLNRAINIPAGSNLEKIENSEIAIGKVTVEDGTVYFDGVPLPSAEQHAIAEACRELQREDRH